MSSPQREQQGLASTSRQQQPPNEPVRIIELPTEILERIISCLNLEHQCSIWPKDGELRSIVMNCVKEAKVRKFTEKVMKHFRDYGHLIRWLSMSNCEWPPNSFTDIMAYCPNLTVIDTVNTKLKYDDLDNLIKKLEALESLSFSLTLVGQWWHSRPRPSPHLKNLYVEVYPNTSQLNMLIYLLNHFRTLQTAHVNFIDTVDTTENRANPEFEEFDHDQWRTLHTLVCSCYLGAKYSPLIPEFLRTLFASRMTPQLGEWISRRKEVYIYEHGYLNDTASDKCLDDARVTLLKRYQFLDLTTINGRFAAPWGPPKSLRVRGVMGSHANLDPSHLFTSQLRELDLTACHGPPATEFLDRLFDKVPRMESLALPLCGLLVETDKYDKKEVAKMVSHRGKLLTEINLKKLYLRGNGVLYKREGTDTVEVRESCEGCRAPLSSENLPQLYDLAHLDELTFEHVLLSDSALATMANPSARTIRITFSETFDFRLLTSFFVRCRSLRNFKLWGFRGSFHKNEGLLRALETAVNVKQLCLGVVILTKYTIPDLAELQFYPRNAETVHFHYLIRPTTKIFVTRLSRSDLKNRKLKMVTPKDHVFGRGLCHSGSFAGCVKPVKWTDDA